MAFKSFGQLSHMPLIVDLTVEENARLKVRYDYDNLRYKQHFEFGIYLKFNFGGSEAFEPWKTLPEKISNDY